jgi:hypothetical protein
VTFDAEALLVPQPAAALDDQGRCCGRKPLEYKRPPQLFCSRCNRSYDPATLAQQPNFAWVEHGGNYRRSMTSVLAAVATDAWSHHKDSGMNRDDFADVVQDIVNEFRDKHRELLVS